MLRTTSLLMQVSRALRTAAALGPRSVFDGVQTAPPIEVGEVRSAVMADPFKNKVDLGIGAYRTEEGEPWVMPWVRKVERMMAEDMSLNHEYLPFLGCEVFTKAATALLLGAENPVIQQGRAFGIQSLSGAGSVRVGCQFLCKVVKYNTVYIPTETWENHYRLTSSSGFPDIREYRYWNPVTKTLDFDGLIEDLRAAPENSVVILHPCAHNPTGCDPTHEQWTKIADVCLERKLFPFFDSAYQGLASGDIEEDAWSVRHFVERGMELFCAQSFSKSCGLYNERVGNLTIVLKNPERIGPIKSQLQQLVRSIYCSPPNHGSRIVSTMLRDPKLLEEWQSCMRQMASRIQDMRNGLKERLHKLGTPGSWEHITQQVGMFSFTGLSERQVQFLRDEHHIYMLSNGRANMCGLNTRNLDYVANAIYEVVTQMPEEDINLMRAKVKN